jgi:hypothetical protein
MLYFSFCNLGLTTSFVAVFSQSTSGHVAILLRVHKFFSVLLQADVYMSSRSPVPTNCRDNCYFKAIFHEACRSVPPSTELDSRNGSLPADESKMRALTNQLYQPLSPGQTRIIKLFSGLSHTELRCELLVADILKDHGLKLQLLTALFSTRLCHIVGAILLVSRYTSSMPFQKRSARKHNALESPETWSMTLKKMPSKSCM